MRSYPLLIVAALVLCPAPDACGQRGRGPNHDKFYAPGPFSQRHDDVPHGELVGPLALKSEVFPDAEHTYWVYVPAQYDPAEPAHLMVFNDGHAFMAPEGDIRATNVIDNLIYLREIPVMIAVFINPGRMPGQPEPTARDWGDRNTLRKSEYDTMDGKYARVIVDELLPALTAEYNLSPDPEHRGIGGSSSGGIAAFSVAWNRPDAFRKVASNVGSFTNIRGGHVYPELVREADPKPIRVFMVDGRNDNRGLRRGRYNQEMDWFHQNVRLKDALEEKGYDVNYVWGIGNHGQKQGGAMLPTMMRWLWRDHAVSTDPHDETERTFHGAAAPEPEDAESAS